MDIKEIDKADLRAKKEIYFHGLTTVDRIQQAISADAELVRQTLMLTDGFCWLDEPTGWFRLLPIQKHGLPKAINKVLAVAGTSINFAGDFIISDGSMDDEAFRGRLKLGESLGIGWRDLSKNEVVGTPISEVVFSYSAVRDRILAAQKKS